MTEPYSSMGLTNDLYSTMIIFSVLILKVRLMRPSLLFAFAAILAMCFEKLKPSSKVIPRSVSSVSVFNGSPFIMY